MEYNKGVLHTIVQLIHSIHFIQIGGNSLIELDLRSRQPIYEQLVEKLKQLIIHRILKQDEQLPSIRALAQQLSINPNTIQKAYRELEAQGYIYSVKGKGSFVNNLSEIDNQADIRRLKEQLRKLIAEAMFLGLTREELMRVIQETDIDANGGEKDDKNTERDETI